MVLFYTAIIEFILTSSITVCYAAATAKDKDRLQHIIRSADRLQSAIPPGPLHLQDPETSRKDCG
ncbi:hypothetical protein LDENG_00249380 [Lucifuga dentata]|nr:hypothetical protein LDENG_00249380 [Lucifuga dentata]